MKLLKFRNLLRRSLIFVAIRIWSRGEDVNNYIVRKDITDICIDGYPRSANSFSVRMFRQSNPGLSIAHHTHAVANISVAIDNNIPVIVLIRDPVEAIASSVIAHKDKDIDKEVDRYIDFYNWIYKNLEHVVIADFDVVVNEFNSVIVKVNRKYKTRFKLIDDIKEADKKVKIEIEKRFDQLGQSEMAYIKPVPTKERNEEKERLLTAVLQHPDINMAKKLYHMIVE